MTKTRKSSDTVQPNLRIKESLRRRLAAAAKQNGVSLNREMIDRLMASFDHADLLTLNQVAERLERASKPWMNEHTPNEMVLT
jgi:hypothetical protein